MLIINKNGETSDKKLIRESIQLKTSLVKDKTIKPNLNQFNV